MSNLSNITRDFEGGAYIGPIQTLASQNRPFWAIIGHNTYPAADTLACAQFINRANEVPPPGQFPTTGNQTGLVYYSWYEGTPSEFNQAGLEVDSGFVPLPGGKYGLVSPPDSVTITPIITSNGAALRRGDVVRVMRGFFQVSYLPGSPGGQPVSDWIYIVDGPPQWNVLGTPFTSAASITSNHTVTLSDNKTLFFLDAASGSFTVTLPDAYQCGIGFSIAFERVDLGYSISGYTVTLNPGTSTIDLPIAPNILPNLTPILTFPGNYIEIRVTSNLTWSVVGRNFPFSVQGDLLFQGKYDAEALPLGNRAVAPLTPTVNTLFAPLICDPVSNQPLWATGQGNGPQPTTLDSSYHLNVVFPDHGVFGTTPFVLPNSLITQGGNTLEGFRFTIVGPLEVTNGLGGGTVFWNGGTLEYVVQSGSYTPLGFQLPPVPANGDMLFGAAHSNGSHFIHGWETIPLGSVGMVLTVVHNIPHSYDYPTWASPVSPPLDVGSTVITGGDDNFILSAGGGVLGQISSSGTQRYLSRNFR